jgi:hypothetical protein
MMEENVAVLFQKRSLLQDKRWEREVKDVNFVGDDGFYNFPDEIRVLVVDEFFIIHVIV